MKSGPVKQAIIENGRIVGWKVIQPMTARQWAKTPEGRKALQEFMATLAGDDSDMEFIPRKGRDGRFYWTVQIL